MALSLFPYLLVAAKEAEGEKKEVLILTATSGDTGKAALEGFKDVPGTHIQVFYPTDGVSPMQAEQMQKQEGDNVNVTAIHGNFDDAQQFLKRLFVDKDTAEEVAAKGVMFSSANSINIGRLAPQVVYYVNAYAELVAQGAIHEDEAFNVVVPTGNFGNILAAYYAKKMGIPIGKLICASNQNNVLTDFFESGTYDMNRPFYTTISPSMDILISSNLERLIYMVSGRNSEKNRELMEALKAEGSYEITEEMKANLADFAAGYATEEETKQTIRTLYEDTGYVIDTHTAVAATVLKAYQRDSKDTRKCVVASTASPYKFAGSVMTAIDGKYADMDDFALIDELEKISGVQVPKAVEEIRSAGILHTKECDADQMEAAVKEILGIK